MSRLTPLLFLLALPALAQHAQMPMSAPDPARDLLARQTSGTSENPAAAPMSMQMTTFEDWMLMWHGAAFLTQVVQTDRGGDGLFAANWIMGTAERHLAGGELRLRSMFSLEPATIPKGGYPEWFQSGEGLINHQHAHDFFMELSAEFAVDLGHQTAGYLYAAPVGDPALGPAAFPHRVSSLEIPQAPLAHHLEDSTHVASNVITIGAKQNEFGLALSGFHGREPDNSNRWDINGGSIDSWSVRGTWDPTPNVTAQVSTGHLRNPEAQEPGSIQRTTASATYFSDGLAASVIWGWNHRSSSDTNGLTIEGSWKFNVSNYLTGRVEVLKKEEFEGTIKALTGGYTKDVYKSKLLLGGVGGNVTLSDAGGAHQVSVYAFVRVRNSGGM
ncbi:MAG TPA: hypothetical protein VL284_05430 [Thermoanaerobaculia bacterium]|nr:hypothetical protein [Thermoanaerobaculia bacterium]